MAAIFLLPSISKRLREEDEEKEKRITVDILSMHRKHSASL